MAISGLRSFIIILPSTVKEDQQITHPNINNSPLPILLCKITWRLPWEITINAPVRERMIPINLNLVNLSLNIKIESMVITEGFKDMIIEARLAVINFNPEKKKKLDPTIPVSPRAIINRNCEKLSRGNLPYFLKTNKTKKKEANKNRKKAEVKGGKFAAIILPATKVLPPNKATRNNFI